MHSAWARSICPLRSMQPQPASLVSLVPGIGEKEWRYVKYTQARRLDCSLAPSLPRCSGCVHPSEEHDRQAFPQAAALTLWKKPSYPVGRLRRGGPQPSEQGCRSGRDRSRPAAGIHGRQKLAGPVASRTTPRDFDASGHPGNSGQGFYSA